MPDETEHSSARRESRRRPTGRRWLWALGILLVIGVPIAIGVSLLAGEVTAVQGSLQSVVPLASTLKKQALDGDIDAATKTHARMSSKVDSAVERVQGSLWAVGEGVPFVGVNFTAVRHLVDVADTVVSDGVAPLIEVASSISPSSFAPVDGAINLEPLVSAVPNVAKAESALKAALADVKKIDTANSMDEVAAGKAKLTKAIEDAVAPVSALNDIVPLVAPALGSDGPRTYAVMFQNNAESRALGGTALSFALVYVDQGRIDITEVIPAGWENFTLYAESVVPVPDGVESIFPNDAYGTYIANVTMRPSFVSAAETVQEFWRREYGTELDGILSIDPRALSYVLRATGPLPLATGDTLTSDNLVPLLLNEVYLKYDSGNNRRDNLAQDLVYANAVDVTFGELSAGRFDPAALVGALSQGWDERRILFWSAHEDVQSQLETIGLNGELPVSDETTDRFGVYFHDHVGSKLNFYLKQSVRVASASCGTDGRQTHRVSVDLTNTIAPSQVKDLPASITGGYIREKLDPAVQRMIVLMYAPPGSQISGATVGGAPVAVEALHDTDYPVGKAIVEVSPGETVSLSYDVVSGTHGATEVEVQTTPMVNPTTVAKEELDCATVVG
ncbi:DUF4012 domain-containing protein [Mycetocola sp. 2940]|uniref:DUF4012 domain-containing protein n=1 Tax=Mycetocola sp. 2940 TaxID=3156452 RepID=UPI0033990CFC